MSDKNRIIIFDTTMRDGEQSPGASMSLEEKLQISNLFDQIGVDIIEAGFPIASAGDFKSVQEISKIITITSALLTSTLTSFKKLVLFFLLYKPGVSIKIILLSLWYFTTSIAKLVVWTLWETIDIFFLKIVFNKVDLPALVGPIIHA